MLALSVGVALLYSYLQTPVFESSATFVAQPSLHIGDTGDLVNSLDTLAGRSSLVATYCNVLQSRSLTEQAISSLQLPPETIQDYTVSCVIFPDSSVMQIIVSGPNPYLAADLANAIGNKGIEYVIASQEIYILRDLDIAVPDTNMISPNHPVDVGFGLLIGLIGGVGVVFIRHILVYQLGAAAHEDDAEVMQRNSSAEPSSSV